MKKYKHSLVDAILIDSDRQPIALKKVGKGRYVPVPAAALEREGLMDPTLKTLEKVFPDATVVELLERKSKRPSNYVKPNREKMQHAFELIGAVDQLLEDGRVAVAAMLLGLLSRIMDVAFSYFSGAPIIFLDALPQIPNALRLLLDLTQGEQYRSGSKWKLKRPHSISAKVPIGGYAPTSDVGAYVGGTYRGKRFWVPFDSGAVLFAANTPGTVVKEITESSPFMIPFLCFDSGMSKKRADGRFVMKLKGDAFFTANETFLTELQDYEDLISVMFETFLGWFRKKKKRSDAWRGEIDAFRPMIRQGIYTQRVMDTEMGYYAAALSLWKHFVLFASSKKGWISEQQAHESVIHFWRIVLPDSAPKNGILVDGQLIAESWDAPSVFWSFLVEYLKNGLNNISGLSMPRSEKTVGVLHQFSGQKYLIIPRMLLAEAYLLWLPKMHYPVESNSGFDVALQRAILSWGIQLKTESKDITWRYAFYPQNAVPTGHTYKLPCLAFPTSQLPDAVAGVLSAVFGQEFGKLDGTEIARIETDQIGVRKDGGKEGGTA